MYSIHENHRSATFTAYLLTYLLYDIVWQLALILGDTVQLFV